MRETFNPECPNCQITIERIINWMDHVGCTPNKSKRYDRLLCYVKMASELRDNTVTIKWLRDYAKDLLKDIDEK